MQTAPQNKAPGNLGTANKVVMFDKDASVQDALMHNEDNASIILDDKVLRATPWTPKSLGRAKTAIIYKVGTVNRTAID